MPPAAAEKDDKCVAGRLKTDAKTKVIMCAGMVFGRTNAAAGVHCISQHLQQAFFHPFYSWPWHKMNVSP